MHRWSATELAKSSHPAGVQSRASLPTGKHNAFQICIAKTKIWRHQIVILPTSAEKSQVIRTLHYIVRIKLFMIQISRLKIWWDRVLLIAMLDLLQSLLSTKARVICLKCKSHYVSVLHKTVQWLLFVFRIKP